MILKDFRSTTEIEYEPQITSDDPSEPGDLLLLLVLANHMICSEEATDHQVDVGVEHQHPKSDAPRSVEAFGKLVSIGKRLKAHRNQPEGTEQGYRCESA